MESVRDALCNSKTLALSRDYYDAVAYDIFRTHKDDVKAAAVTVSHVGESLTVANVPIVQIGAVTITVIVQSTYHRYFIVGDTAYSLPVKYSHACRYADGEYTLSDCRKVVSGETYLDILRFLSRYTPIQPYLRLNITPAPKPAEGVHAVIRSAGTDPAVATLFPTQCFSHCPPVIMDGAFAAKYARHVPADGQLQVAWISDEAAEWLAKLHDHGDINRRGLFACVPTVEDVADIMAVFGELGIQSMHIIFFPSARPPAGKKQTRRGPRSWMTPMTRPTAGRGWLGHPP